MKTSFAAFAKALLRSLPLQEKPVKRDVSPGVDAHGRESLNFHISWTIYGLIVGAIAAALFIFIIGIFILPVLFIGWLAMLILVVMGSVKASNGELYRYPLTIRFL